MLKLSIENNPPELIKELTDASVQDRIVLFFTEPPLSSPTRIQFEISCTGIDFELLVVVLGKGQDQFNFDLNVRHQVPDCRSRVYVRAILDDESSFFCNGKLFVAGSAQKSDTFLSCDTLMLSSTTCVKAIPSLEIIANDVTASHKASIGGFDENSLFYLQSRGFDLSKAKQLLTEGFLISSAGILSELGQKDKDKLKKNLVGLVD